MTVHSFSTQDKAEQLW